MLSSNFYRNCGMRLRKHPHLLADRLNTLPFWRYLYRVLQPEMILTLGVDVHAEDVVFALKTHATFFNEIGKCADNYFLLTWLKSRMTAEQHEIMRVAYVAIRVKYPAVTAALVTAPVVVEPVATVTAVTAPVADSAAAAATATDQQPPPLPSRSSAPTITAPPTVFFLRPSVPTTPTTEASAKKPHGTTAATQSVEETPIQQITSPQ